MSTEDKQYGVLRIKRSTGECFLCHESLSSKREAIKCAKDLTRVYNETSYYAPIELVKGWTYKANYE